MMAAFSPRNKITPGGNTPASNQGELRIRAATMQGFCRSDSFSQSLHKDIRYPAVNVSRKSSPSSEDSPQDDPFCRRRRRSSALPESHRSYHKSIGPDNIYPKQTPTTPKQMPSPEKNNTEPGTKKKKKGKENSESRTEIPEGKQLNTPPFSSHDVSATIGRGWYSCFKNNNNYLFVRNCRGSYYHKTGEKEESPWYKSYNILESKYHIGIGAEGKALDFSPPEPSPSAKNPPNESPYSDLSILVVDDDCCRSIEPMSKRSIRGASGGKPSPADTRSEDLLIDYHQNDSVKRHRVQKKGPASWLRKLRTPRKTPMKLPAELRPYNIDCSGPYRTPRCSSLEKMSRQNVSEGPGPHTSTPRDSVEKLIGSPSRCKTNAGFTPRRATRQVDGPSVRRRLPYTPVKPNKNLDLMTLSPNEPQRRERQTSKESLDLISWDDTRTKGNRMFSETLPRTRKNASLPEMSLKPKRLLNECETYPLQKDTSISAPNFRSSDRRELYPLRSETPTRDQWEADENDSLNQKMGKPTEDKDMMTSINDTLNDLAYIDDDESFDKTEDRNQELVEEGEGPVSSWLKEVRMMTEGECLNALQAKVIAKKDLLGSVAVGNAQEAAERIWDSGIRVLEHLQLSKRILVQHYDHPDSSPSGRWSSFCTQLDRFCLALREFLKRKSPNLSPKPSTSSADDATTDSGIDEDCGEIFNAVTSGECLMDQPGWKEKTLLEMDASERSFRKLLEKLVSQQITVITNQLEEGGSEISVKRSLYAVILLGKQFGPDLCKLLAEADVVRTLLSICLEKKWCTLYACALRALTIVCCSTEAVRLLKQCGGMECIADILCDDQLDEKTKSEAAGLLAQATAPWTESSSQLLSDPTFRKVGSQLVKSLTSLAEETCNTEVFLLGAAAIANISFCEEAAKFWIPTHETLHMLNGCRDRKDVAGSLFAIDQSATVFANCASQIEGRQQMLMKNSEDKSGTISSSVVSLLSFLQVRTCSGQTKAETAACERIQQKAAVAIARLCGDPNAAHAIADMQGIQCLVKLCKDKRERNNSDSVLVACLAALKKIAAIRGDEEVRKLGAADLVEQSLWEAFLAHSAKNESYV